MTMQQCGTWHPTVRGTYAGTNMYLAPFQQKGKFLSIGGGFLHLTVFGQVQHLPQHIVN
jgi:hypothetical protein